MLLHVILGLLRDGRPRHGYELMCQYRARSGAKLSAGNFYRELARMTADSFVEAGVNPPGADPRRIPYQIAERGRQSFDHWLVTPSTIEHEIEAWLLFVHLVPDGVRGGLLDRAQENLWFREKTLTRRREDAMAAETVVTEPDARLVLPVVLSRQIKLAAAELEFIKELRQELDKWRRLSAPQRAADPVAKRDSPSRGTRQAARRRTDPRSTGGMPDWSRGHDAVQR